MIQLLESELEARSGDTHQPLGAIPDYEVVRNQLRTDIFVLHYMPLTGPMSNLVSSTELLETGTFCYRLNTTSCKTPNWLPVVKEAKLAEGLQLEERYRWPADFAVCSLHPGLLILCHPDRTSLPLENLMLNLQAEMFKPNMHKYVAVGAHWNVLDSMPGF